MPKSISGFTGASLEGLNSDEIPEGATPYLGTESISYNEAMKLIETENGQIERAD